MLFSLPLSLTVLGIAVQTGYAGVALTLTNIELTV